MQTSACSRNRPRWLGLSVIALLVMVFPLSSFAALGGDASSVEADRAKMQASLQTRETDSFTVHEIHSPSGTIVREYVSRSGQVFGVSWMGPFMPDMRQLLGTYFQQYVAEAKTAAGTSRGRKPFHIAQPNLVLQNSGHMRFYSGKAYDPALLPQGVTANDVR